VSTTVHSTTRTSMHVRTSVITRHSECGKGSSNIPIDCSAGLLIAWHGAYGCIAAQRALAFASLLTTGRECDNDRK
jgi:hypothetical protein